MTGRVAVASLVGKCVFGVLFAAAGVMTLVGLAYQWRRRKSAKASA